MGYDGLAGRVAIVTGANHGIGAATAQLLAAHGARVLLSYLRGADPPTAGARHRPNGAGGVCVVSLCAAGASAAAVEADLRSADAAGRLFDAAEGAFGPVEILINN